MKCLSLIFVSIILSTYPGSVKSNPNVLDKSGFVIINKEIPSILYDIKYNGKDNFLGTKVEGYQASYCYLSSPASKALKNVQDEASQFGLTLKIFDCYRPQRAVNHFVKWSKDYSDKLMKNTYYPKIKKEDLIPKGYIADKSGHSRGSTLDLTLADTKTGKELDMGTPFDFFDTLSNTADSRLTLSQKKNRLLLKALMEKHGFVNYDKEWWHFTLKDEPYPETYFNFPVK